MIYGNIGPMGQISWAIGGQEKIKGNVFFLATKASNCLWFGTVIGSDHLHTHNGNYVPYVAVCGPQGPYLNIKGLIFLSNQGSYLALVWYGNRY